MIKAKVTANDKRVHCKVKAIGTAAELTVQLGMIVAGVIDKIDGGKENKQMLVDSVSIVAKDILNGGGRCD